MNTTSVRSALIATNLFAASSFLLLCMAAVRDVVERDAFTKSCAVFVAVVASIGMLLSAYHLMWWFVMTAGNKGEQEDE